MSGQNGDINRLSDVKLPVLKGKTATLGPLLGLVARSLLLGQYEQHLWGECSRLLTNGIIASNTTLLF